MADALDAVSDNGGYGTLSIAPPTSEDAFMRDEVVPRLEAILRGIEHTISDRSEKTAGIHVVLASLETQVAHINEGMAHVRKMEPQLAVLASRVEDIERRLLKLESRVVSQPSASTPSIDGLTRRVDAMERRDERKQMVQQVMAAVRPLLAPIAGGGGLLGAGWYLGQVFGG